MAERLGMKIYIDPSGQENNQYAGGPTGYNDSEEYWMRHIAGPVADKLRLAGHTVRIGGPNGPAANAKDANNWGAQRFYSLHTNAGGGHGTETWYYTGSGVGRDMAIKIQATVGAESDQADRGVKFSTQYIALNSTRMPAIICELLFHDNVTEAAELRRDHDKFVTAIVKGILAHCGGEVPVTMVEYLEYRIHGLKADKPHYVAAALAKNDTLRCYKTSKDSWQSWPPSNA